MSDLRLEAARPLDRAERPAFVAKFPWKWLLVGIGVVAAAGGGYRLHAGAKQRELRAEVHALYEARAKRTADRYRALRTTLESSIVAAVGMTPAAGVETPSALLSEFAGEGLYLRLKEADGRSAETIDRAARSMPRDAIPRCLGISPSSAKGLYTQGQFLMPSWVERLDAAEGEMGIRVLGEDLKTRVARDLPNVERMLASRYFLLAIDRASAGTVDVFLWDLPTNRQVLALRTRADGAVTSVRIAGSARTPLPDPSRTAAAAADCSVAAQVQAALQPRAL